MSAGRDGSRCGGRLCQGGWGIGVVREGLLGATAACVLPALPGTPYLLHTSFIVSKIKDSSLAVITGIGNACKQWCCLPSCEQEMRGHINENKIDPNSLAARKKRSHDKETRMATVSAALITRLSPACLLDCFPAVSCIALPPVSQSQYLRQLLTPRQLFPAVCLPRLHS